MNANERNAVLIGRIEAGRGTRLFYTGCASYVISCSAVAEPHGGLSKMKLVDVDGSFGEVCFLILFPRVVRDQASMKRRWARHFSSFLGRVCYQYGEFGG